MSLDLNLTRVQVYLDPKDISLLDKLADKINITRSQIIRDATKAVAERYVKVSELLAVNTLKTNPLKELIGIEKSKTGKIGINIDDVYLHD